MKMSNDEYYNMFAQTEADFGQAALIYMGVKTTGIFCRPGCPARLPLRKNCEFFPDAEKALNAGYRACKRCHPLRLPGEASGLIKTLINLVESDISRSWSEEDLSASGIDPSTARRHFKARFGITFAQYARGRRLGDAAKTLRKGESVINAQLEAGYESAPGFRAAFSKTFGTAPKNVKGDPLCIDWIDTPLGPMISVASEEALYLLEFTDRKHITRQFNKLTKLQGRAIVPGQTAISHQTRDELTAYFKGDLQGFTMPLITSGTDFQKQTWQALCDIPFGETRSYAQLACAVGNEKAVRAVAGSNAANGLAIIIPCHRVIRTGGHLGGYAGNLSRKQWLLEHELKFKTK
ncbi:MAG: bifunctional transcriptional activator/DNA repair enzyme AdaA [Maricaulaceae bacterium]